MSMNFPHILDCTLRDGGYYNDWNFEKSIVDEYLQAINMLPVDYIEVGYRNNSSKSYLGKYGYCPVFELANIRDKSKKNIAIMLDEKKVVSSDLPKLLDPLTGLVDMIRIAVDPKYFDRAILLAEEIRKRGFKVGLNAMYMSKWKEFDGFLDNLMCINDIVDLFCMVDSFGSVSPADIRETLLTVKEKVTCAIGFHGHNNLELSLINAITAMDNGIDYIDSTALGMGRGAGNLKTELLLTYMNKHYGLEVDFNILGDMVTTFSSLYEKYKWGTNLPYMISGANSLPQKDIMEWVNNRYYSLNNIIRAMDNRKSKIKDNAKYPIAVFEKTDTVVIIGGGKSAISHVDGVKAFLKTHQSVALIHATARNAVYYRDLDIPQYYCLIGREGKRLSSTFADGIFNGLCILPPYPREMGTDVPDFVHNVTVELPYIEFTTEYLDSCTAIALQIAALCCDHEIFIMGYDGYSGNILSEKEASLTNENRFLFSSFKNFFNKPLFSLVPSLYRELDIQSLYQYL